MLQRQKRKFSCFLFPFWFADQFPVALDCSDAFGQFSAQISFLSSSFLLVVSSCRNRVAGPLPIVRVTPKQILLRTLDFFSVFLYSSRFRTNTRQTWGSPAILGTVRMGVCSTACDDPFSSKENIRLGFVHWYHNAKAAKTTSAQEVMLKMKGSKMVQKELHLSSVWGDQKQIEKFSDFIRMWFGLSILYWLNFAKHIW